MTMKINLQDIKGIEKFYSLIIGFESDIDVSIDRYTVDAKSLLGLVSLNVSRDLTLTVHEKVEGEALKIRDLMRDNGFLVEE